MTGEASMRKPLSLITALLAITWSALTYSQVSVNVGGQRVVVQSSSGSNIVTNNEGEISSDSEITGITVINGNVFIDGQKIKNGVTSYTSKKTGKTFRIVWGKNGNVSVEEK